MKTNIIDSIFSINKTIVRLAAVAALAVTAFIAVEQNTPKADANNFSFVRVCTFFSPGRADFYSTTNPTQCQNGVGGYSKDLSTNTMFLDPSAPQPPNTVAIFNWYSPSRLDNRLIRSDVTPCSQPGVTSTGGYTCVRKEGYTFKTEQTENTVTCGTVRVSMSWSAANTDAAFFPSATPPAGYVNQYGLGYARIWAC